jgi:hypothetical protein
LSFHEGNVVNLESFVYVGRLGYRIGGLFVVYEDNAVAFVFFKKVVAIVAVAAAVTVVVTVVGILFIGATQLDFRLQNTLSQFSNWLTNSGRNFLFEN